MSSKYSAASPSQHIIFLSDAKPLRFAGVLLAATSILDEDNGESDTRVRLFRTEKGSLIWAWDRIEHGYLPDEPEPENIQRSDALVISATEGSRPATDVVAEAWDRRPTGNRRLAEASVRVWHDAARRDNAIAQGLYTDVE
ncbi:MAG: hypothetical protein ABI647_14320 [Gemmatimonadota bacterium]